MDNCQNNKNSFPPAFWEALKKLPAFRYLKAPVDNVAQLYEKYFDGNEKGTFAFVYNENTFYTYHPRGWHRGEWKPISGGMSSFFDIDKDLLLEGDILVYDAKQEKFVVKSGNVWNKITEKFTQVTKFLNEVDYIPTDDDNAGVYYIHNTNLRGLYIVLSGKSIKIFNSSDWYSKTEVDEKIEVVNNHIDSEVERIEDNMAHMGIRKIYPSYEAMQNDIENPIGDDGTPIRDGEIVSVFNSNDINENALYIYRPHRTPKEWEKTSSLGTPKITQELTEESDTVPSNKAVKRRALSIGLYDNVHPIITDQDDKIMLGWMIKEQKFFLYNLLKTLSGQLNLDIFSDELRESLEKTDYLQLFQNENWYLGAIDAEDSIFWGIDRNRDMYLFGKKVNDAFIGFTYISNNDWILAIVDSEDKVVWGVDRNLTTYPDGVILKELDRRVETLEEKVKTLDPDNIGLFNILDLNFMGSFSTFQELEAKYPLTDIRYVLESDPWQPSLLVNDKLVGNSDLRKWYASVNGFFTYVRWDGTKHEWYISGTAIEIRPTTGLRLAIYKEVSLGSDFEDIIKQVYLTNNVLISNTLSTIKAFEPDVLLIPNAGYTQFKTGISLSTYLTSLTLLLSGLTNTLTTILVYSAPNIDTGYSTWLSQIKDRCDAFSIRFIDLFAVSGINTVNKYLYILDEVTLNNIGSRRISTSFEFNPFRNTQTNKRGIPVIYIDTVDGLFFDNLLKSATMKMARFEVDIKNSGLKGFEGTLVPDKDEIRGRGNSTWTMPKKPYRLKFDKKVSFFGLPAEKNWVLLALYEDKASIRTPIAHNLGHAINEYRLSNSEETWYCPTAQMVEVVLNGRYDGLYCFTDHVSKVTSSRVNIPEPAPEDIAVLNTTLGHYELKPEIYPNVSGGFLIELEADFRAEEEIGVPIVDSNNIVTGSTGDVFIRAPYGPSSMPIRYFACKTLEFYKKDFVTPSAPNGIVLQSYMNYITGFITEVNTIIMGSKDIVDGKTYLERVSEYIDINTFIDYFFVQEIVKNADAVNFSSIYYNKDRDKVVNGVTVKGKLKAGPVWDFAASLGNYTGLGAQSPEGWWVRNNVWIYELTRDPSIKQLFIARWNEINLSSKWSEIMDKWVTQSYTPANKDNERWATSGSKSYFQSLIPFSPTLSDYYEQEVVWLRKWTQERINWINNNINSL